MTFLGPGHGSVVQTPDEEFWFVYHAWLFGKIGQVIENVKREKLKLLRKCVFFSQIVQLQQQF